MTGTISFGKETKGQGSSADHRSRRQGGEELVPKGKEHPGARRPGGQQGRIDCGRPRRPTRHPALAGHRRAVALHRGRSAGRLPLAGREDQRQAHRGDRSPDAAPRGGGEPGESNYIAGEQVERPRSSTPTRHCRPRQDPRDLQTCCWVSRRPSLSTDSFISAASFRKRPRADRSGDHGQARRAARV